MKPKTKETIANAGILYAFIWAFAWGAVMSDGLPVTIWPLVHIAGGLAFSLGFWKMDKNKY